MVQPWLAPPLCAIGMVRTPPPCIWVVVRWAVLSGVPPPVSVGGARGCPESEREREREGEIQRDGVSRPLPPVGVGGVCGGLTKERERKINEERREGREG